MVSVAPGKVGSIPVDSRFRVLDRLGEGGMGEVYLVEHTDLGRRQALKVLRASLTESPEFAARFRREARAATRVQHPNIVQVYDFGRLADGRYFLAMEHVTGETLHDRLQRQGPLSAEQVIDVLGPLAAAVGHAHSCGVIHRDLKPANVMLARGAGPKEIVKVLDFGIAKIVAPDYEESVGLTPAGEIFGTAEYMAPEQVQGVGTDPRSDLYALGCIAFELLVGTPPFQGRTLEILHAHLSKAPEAPSHRRRDGRVTPELDAAVLRCLEKDPARRFATGGELAHALSVVPRAAERPRPTPRGRKTLSGERTASRRAMRVELDEVTASGDAPVAAPPSDFDSGAGDSTAAGDFGADLTAPGPGATALPTAALTADGARVALHVAVRRLAEQMIRGGDAHPLLLDGIARLGGMERALTRLEQRAGELERETEMARRRRGGASRTALERLTDDAISLAAERARREEELASTYGAVDRLVARLLETRTRDRALTTLADEVSRLRRQVATLERPARRGAR